MNHLILVKHAHPEIIPDVSAKEWRLSPTGQVRSKVLAETLAPFLPDLIFSSLEPKAIETAQIAAAQLDKPYKSCTGLHEPDRTGVGFMDREPFETAVKNFFEQPDKLVFGNETANQALERFSKAVKAIERDYPDKNIVVVAHGTVITLFVNQFNQIEPFSFWEKLDLPSFVVLSPGEHKLIKTVESVV